MTETGTPALTPQRIDLNNTAVNQAAAGAGLCASVHMATGRMCALPARHRGGCRFEPVPKVAEVYGSHPLLRDWASHD